MAEGAYDVSRGHKYFSANAFNRCWDLIDNPTRSDEETVEMIAAAYSSLWHWTNRNDVTPQNLSVSYWQLGRVHNLAADTRTAVAFGSRCVEIGKANELPPFYIAYGYEVLAHAAVIEGRTEDARSHLAEATRLAVTILDAEEKSMIDADLENLRRRIE